MKLPSQWKDKISELASEYEGGDWNAFSSNEGYGEIEKLENNVVKHFGGKWSIAMNSATSALITALFATGIKPGDEVICPAYTWPQTVFGVFLFGAIPVFADSHPNSPTVNPGHIESLLTSKTAAVISTHLYGYASDLSAIKKICDRKSIPLILDAAQGIGITYEDSRKLADIADFTALSFGRGKIICAGEGGALIGKCNKMYDRSLLISQHPLKTVHKLHDLGNLDAVSGLSYNFRLHPWLAALANLSLDELQHDFTKDAKPHNVIFEGFVEDEILDGSIPEGSLIVGKMSPEFREIALDKHKDICEPGRISQLLPTLLKKESVKEYFSNFTKLEFREMDFPEAHRRVDEEILWRAELLCNRK